LSRLFVNFAETHDFCAFPVENKQIFIDFRKIKQFTARIDRVSVFSHKYDQFF